MMTDIVSLRQAHLNIFYFAIWTPIYANKPHYGFHTQLDRREQHL